MKATLTHLGVRFRENRQGWQQVSCPSDYHPRGDRNPSASVNVSEGGFACHGCPLKGDGFDLMRFIKGLDAKDALVALGLTADGEDVIVSEWIL